MVETRLAYPGRVQCPYDPNYRPELHQANYSNVNSLLISNFSILFRSVALVMPRSLAA